MDNTRTTPFAIPLDEPRTFCDQCEQLRKCIDEGYVANISRVADSTPHYTIGLGAFCPLIGDKSKLMEVLGLEKTHVEGMTGEEIFQYGLDLIIGKR